MSYFQQWTGYCPLCRKDAVFETRDPWLRDYLMCTSCPGGSVPRERAMMLVTDRVVPDWRGLAIHECSPAPRGFSLVLRKGCAGYVATHFFPGVPLGTHHQGFRCEDVERQTFADASFDVVITQDVMEHVFHPDLAYREIARTLKPGGVHIHTTPMYKERTVSERRAALVDGAVRHLAEAEYHGNPIDGAGSLVTYHYGYDLPELIAAWTGMAVEVARFHDPHHGILGEFTEVIVCRKPDAPVPGVAAPKVPLSFRLRAGLSGLKRRLGL